MSDFLSIFSRFSWQSALDVLLVALVFYAVLRVFRGTQAVQLLRGILVIVLVIGGFVLVSIIDHLQDFSNPLCSLVWKQDTSTGPADPPETAEQKV